MVKFRLFGFPITIQWWFWLICLFFGLILGGNEPGREGLFLMLAAVPILFVSIVGHELGHAWLRKKHGAPYSEIVLHGLGGYCTGPGSFNKSQRIQILLAGPIFNLLLAGLCKLILLSGVFANPTANDLTEYVMFLNLFVGIFNLLPIWPMDGGQIFETLMRGNYPLSIVYKVSFALAILVGMFGMLRFGPFMVIIMAQIAMQNWTKITGQGFRGF